MAEAVTAWRATLDHDTAEALLATIAPRIER
jgi:hypothetical protein